MRVLLFLILILPNIVFAQNENKFAKLSKFFLFGERDTNYIKPHFKEYNLQFNSWLNSQVFYIDPPFISGNKQNITLSPNLSPQAGISLGLKYLSVALSYNLPVSLSNITQYGRTRFFDLDLSYYRGFFATEFNLNIFNGLYQNTNKGSKITIKEDSHLNAVGLNFFYVLNHKKFSFRSAIKMQEIQAKSAGSFVLMLNTGYRTVFAKNPFISISDSLNSYGLLNNTNRFRLLNISLRPGYAHNFSIKKGKYFIKPALFIGPGFSNLLLAKNKNVNITITEDYDIHSKIAMGYNGPNYFFNIYGNYDATLVRLKSNNTLSFNHTLVGFIFGYRFKNFSKKYPWL